VLHTTAVIDYYMQVSRSIHIESSTEQYCTAACRQIFETTAIAAAKSKTALIMQITWFMSSNFCRWQHAIGCRKSN